MISLKDGSIKLGGRPITLALHWDDPLSMSQKMNEMLPDIMKIQDKRMMDILHIDSGTRVEEGDEVLYHIITNKVNLAHNFFRYADKEKYHVRVLEIDNVFILTALIDKNLFKNLEEQIENETFFTESMMINQDLINDIADSKCFH